MRLLAEQQQRRHFQSRLHRSIGLPRGHSDSCAPRAALCCHAHTDNYNALLQRAVAPLSSPFERVASRWRSARSASTGPMWLLPASNAKHPKLWSVVLLVWWVHRRTHAGTCRKREASETRALLALQVPERVHNALIMLRDTTRCYAVQENAKRSCSTLTGNFNTSRRRK